ncbi:MAG TPA: hypothetical protein ENK57_06690 [Polyangiaceae bacterium]|nr:hypothetical protein [Polyangiaceae bacterium]
MAHPLIHALCLATLVVGCAPRTPTPPIAPHEGDAPVPVPYPPPSPRAQEIGRRPSETAVWVDGQWRWDGGGYAWLSGAWVEPRPGWAYAPPEVVRLRNGELLYYEGRWKEWSPDEGDGS